MFKIRGLLYLFFAICFIACSDDNNEIQFTKGDIPRDVAYELALKKLNVSLKDVDIWATKEKLPAKTFMEIFYFQLTSPDTESWLFFVDETPMANWGHACQYAFVDMNGNVFVYHESMPPDFGQYKMERINFSEASKKVKTDPIIPDVKRKSRSTALLENHYAIILSGGGVDSTNHIRYWNDCSYIYKTLVNGYGYDPSKIYVLMADGINPGIDNSNHLSSNPDLDGDQINDIDYAATNSNLDYVFNQLSSQLTNEDYLFIYTIDHGGINPRTNVSFLVMWNNQLYYANEFASKVKAIKTKATNIVMGQCNSGGFAEYFTDTSNICISTACGKYEVSHSMDNGLYDEYLYYWTQSHGGMAGDTNNDGHVSALESHYYAHNRDTQDETTFHYGAGYLSKRLALTGMFKNIYGTYFDGYCIFNYDIDLQYPFYADEPNHEPEFGVTCGDKIDVTITHPNINDNTFSWSIVENNGYTAVFVPNDTHAHLEIGSQSPVGQRIRVKVEADIPEDNYYLSQYLNFYITSNYRIARSENNVLFIENVSTDNTSATYTLNASASTFNYQIMDEGTNNIRMSGSYPKNQKIELDISQLSSGVYTLIIRENGEIKANQRLTI